MFSGLLNAAVGLSLPLLPSNKTLSPSLGCLLQRWYVESYCNLLCHIWLLSLEGLLFSQTEEWLCLRKEIGWGFGKVEGRETVVWRHCMRENKIVLKTQELKEGHGIHIQVTHLFTWSFFILPLSSKRGGVTRGPFCSNMLLLAFCFLLLLQRPYPSCYFWLPSFWHFIDVIFLLVFWKLKSLLSFKEPIVTIYVHDAVFPD